MDSFDTSKNFLSYPSLDFILPDDFANDFTPFGDPSFHSGFVDENTIAHGDMFGLNDSAAIGVGVGVGDHHSASAGNFMFMQDGYPSMFNEVGKNNGEDDEDDDDDDDDSSGTTTTTTTTTNSAPSKMKTTKVDRSKTLVSERRRRGRMKEKLYALRALVPNITKMDKASIVGDAVLYVQDLQKQAKKLKDEIGELEASLVGGANNQNDGQPHHHHHHHLITQPTYRKILQMDVFDVEERGFYLRVVSNRGNGVAMSLHKALESLTTFIVQSSNLASASSPDRFILTSTLMMKEGEQKMDISSVKLWITGALLHQGFQLAVSP